MSWKGLWNRAMSWRQHWVELLCATCPCTCTCILRVPASAWLAALCTARCWGSGATATRRGRWRRRSSTFSSEHG